MNTNEIIANTFPKKLYSFIEDEEGKSVYWSKHGCAFYITDNDLLCDALPKYFKLTKLTSFQRQLNLYGFRRLNKGEDQGAYFHPKFQRNRKDLLAEVHRLPGKGTLSTLEQVLNNTVEHIPNNKDIIEHINTELSNKQTSQLTTHSKLQHKPNSPSNQINKQPKQTKRNIEYIPNLNTSANSIAVSSTNINTSTIPTSALYLNSSQYQQQYSLAYNMQNSISNNFYRYIPNHQSHYYPTSSVNSFNTLYSSLSNFNNCNNSSISSSFNTYNYSSCNDHRNYRNNNNAISETNNLNIHNVNHINDKYLNLSNQDHFILDGLIDVQTASNCLDRDTEVNNNDQIQINNNNTSLTSRMKDNLLSAFMNDDNEECTNNK